MAVPDLLDTQGTYTFYTTTRLEKSGSSTRVVRVRPNLDGSIESVVEGPPDPLRAESGPMQVPLTITPTDSGARVRPGKSETDVNAVTGISESVATLHSNAPSK